VVDERSPVRCEPGSVLEDGRLVSPSAERNKSPIGEVLAQILPAQGLVLEVASGTGQHIVHFARLMPHLAWQPTDQDAGCLRSIASWLAAEAPTNVHAPLSLDVHVEPWPVASAAAVISINMIHIAPPSASEALFRGARSVLSRGGVLFLYGPFRQHGRHTSASNESFDRQLREQNPEWGVRNLDDVAALAAGEEFDLDEIRAMPAKNLALIFLRR
jgi:SAM-dependent methyltransferase